MSAEPSQVNRRFFGVVPAVIAEVNAAGECRLQFPWLDKDMVTDQFCRVAHLYAGKNYGTFFIPEVGDEVLVGFMHGNVQTPVILGGMYNGVDLAASDRSGPRDEKLIRTKAGHEIRFFDTPQQEKIVVQDMSGKAQIEMTTDGGTGPVIKITASGGTIEISGKTIKLAADDALELTGSSVKVTAKGGDVTIKASTQINLN